MCGKAIVSIYAANNVVTVYCQRCWWSDKWDAKDYAQEYDFSKPFFTQFIELQKKVPALAMVNDDGITSMNCEYTQDFAFGKNCYMVLVAWKVENCLYGMYLVSGREVVDALSSMGECENTYETVYTEKCYNCKYVYYSLALSDSFFCYDCRDCQNCFLSVGLRHKQYCIKNKQHTKEEYENIIAEYRLDTYNGIERAKKEFKEIYYTVPRKFANVRKCLNTTGDGLSNAKNSKFCFNAQRLEDCKWVENSDTPKDCYDLSTGGELNQCYEGVTPDHSYRALFAIFSWKNTEVSYVDGCHSSKYLFGCCGLKKSEYCILNKQYSKEEYGKMVGKIKEQMEKVLYVDTNGARYTFGEFFPPELSYFRYNESAAAEEFPLTEEEIKNKGLEWQNAFQLTTGKETLRSHQIPDAIGDVPESITKEVLMCVECARNYRIIEPEFEFYRRMNIPIPRTCFYCRHKARLRLRNPFKLRHAQCECQGTKSARGNYENTTPHFHNTGPCPNQFYTPYPSGSPEIVYCEECYQTEIV